jgi:acetyl/propionyl-CoA carboxylase alpha subunit/acetyl-CoA carboxylase carboxyltransferase component
MALHQRVLIANRGEIAIRIARAAASLGIESVAVHAPVDAHGRHVRVATTARVLPGDGVAAYLDAGALLRIARDTGCDCVHPGYGFLAENASFAEWCATDGITFVGPPPNALALFGDKVRARALAASLGIPVVAGSTEPLLSAAEAADVADRLGYPVMLKAAAGGGGRGMREVHRPEDLADAFDRCRSEAEAAFGDGSVFVERLLARPRHLEVQVLADAHGTVVHLHERDCSVQLRHQKVVEIAPAPNLDPAVRERLCADAVRLVAAAGYVNAGTVEFLVDPASGAHFFIECNPRIQVEHTVTEQVTGIDLVEAQFHLAGGATLASLGLADQASVGAPRGFSVQARVVARGAGVLSHYHEPSGPGVRVDACGYPGYAPPPQFDPLLAKVIGSSAGTLAAALDRTRRALGEFDLAGVPANLASLRAILAHPAVGAGDARTTLLGEAPELLAADDDADRAAAAAAGPSADSLPVPEGHQGVTSPVGATVVEWKVAPGAAVAAGSAIVVLSAMKMETVLTAPVAGIVTAVGPAAAGETVTAGQVVAVVAPDDGVTPTALPPEQTWAPVLDDIRTLQGLAAARMAPGSTDPGVVRQRDRGKLTCRERIDALLDPGTFREVGSVAGFASYDDDGRIAAFTPANHVGGHGRIEGRPVIVCADDFTSRGGHSDGAIGAKSAHLDRLSIELRVPSLRLLDGSSGGGSVASMVPEQRKSGESTAKESSGAITAGRPRVSGGGGSFLPGHLGSTMYAQQLVTVPVVNVLLGSVVGLGAAKAVLGHFSVMVRDIAQLFVAGPPVVSHAMGYDVTKEDLGGWHIHCRNGSVDNLAESEQDAFEQARRFLSYLPASVHDAPPVAACDPNDPVDRAEEELFTLVPRKRTTTFDVRRAIELIADVGSFFEIGRYWGTDQVVGFVRMNGHPMGVIASDSRHVNGGALTADGCDKVRRHLDLCDLFHLPVLNLCDNPGFAVGIEHEMAGTIRKGGEWMVAFAQLRVPMFTVILRRSFGVAGNNWATPRMEPSMRVVWPAADLGGIPPEGGIEAAYKRQLAEAADPAALRAEIEARIESARGPLGPLSKFQVEEMIDPRDTRALVCDWVPGAYRIVGHLAASGARPIGFRP